MPPSTTYARIALFVVGINAVGMLTAPVAEPAWPWWMEVFVDGQLALLIIWAALASAPWYFRWPCVGGIPYLLARPWPVASSWGDRVVMVTMPHALVALMSFCLLRELGLRIAPDGDAQPRSMAVPRFTLRRMFAWMAGAAAMSLAWKRLFELQGAVWWTPAFKTWQLCLLNAGIGASTTLLDVISLFIALGRSRLRVRLRWLCCIVLVASAQLVYVRLYKEALIWQFSWHDFWTICQHDLLYLAPVVAVLLLASAADYRLTWTAGDA
ncbi:MAG TPA: hypothetical protein VFI31_00780 [Pirellulales bacterium]|nr:hypothetical protein [Pirellulales bacterium]